jgi:hypothetical protein
MNIARVIAVALSLAALPPLSDGQVEVSKLGELVGFTVVADTNIQGEFEGPDFDRVVKLDNGWVVEFHEYDYFYEYHPEVVVLARQIGTVVLYKVGIEGGDDAYDITRLR